MEIQETIAGFRKALDAERAAGRTVGLVPTMGYLHAGHAALMRRAAAECDIAAASIFVNPLQFGQGEDLASYPRDLERDTVVAREAGVVHLFTPSVDEMYPGPASGLWGRPGPVPTSVTVKGLAEGLEAATRPGHFDGVATVVAKLFAIAGPCRAYFGEKDFQQLAVVSRMAADLSFPVEVVGCPTVRDDDGLALSSRNAYLSTEERRAATVLHSALLEGKRMIEEEHERDAAAVRAAMAVVVATEPAVRLDYAEVVDPASLEPLSPLAGPLRLLIAAYVGPARLIDNIGANG